MSLLFPYRDPEIIMVYKDTFYINKKSNVYDIYIY